MTDILSKIDYTKLPQHVAIIMDGNGRWAKQRGLPRTEGHKKGVESVKEVIEACLECGIKYLTLYAFSTENWKRPKSEINFLFNLLKFYIKKERKNFLKEKIKLNILGDISMLPVDLVKMINKICDETKNNDRLILNIALNYGARQEILNAVNKIISQNIKKVDINTIENFLYTKGLPEPDLLIRTSGEIRISNFLLWQIAYTELYFTNKLWPDFRKQDFYEAIIEYQKRERRLGGI